MSDKKCTASPFFSICIPVFNGEKFLRECIDSVLIQSEKDYEIILVDDGSSDQSAAICDQYVRKYDFIKAIYKENEGPLLARHDAVGMSSGQYLLFLDCDDLYEQNLLKTVKCTIQKTGADMVIFDIRRFSDEGDGAVLTEAFETDTCFEENTKQAFCEYFILNASLNSMCRKCIRRDIYNADADLSRFKGMIQGEDRLASLSCIDKARKIVYLKEPLYRYRENIQSTSYNTTLRNYRDLQVLYVEVNKYMELWALPSAAPKRQQVHRLHSAYNCVVSVATRIRNGESTKKDLQEAVMYISEDQAFTEAYRLCKDRLGIYKRIICRCIIKKCPRTLETMVWATQGIKRILTMKKRPAA